MAEIRAFRAIRPIGRLAKEIAALPYDVYSTAEAREVAKDNPYSFLHVDKAEIDLPDYVNLYDASVYEKAAENFRKMLDNGWLFEDSEECLYIYRLTMDGRSQTGIVGLTAVDEYLNGTIKKHELTRKDKEEDRFRHIMALEAQTGPIFMTYKAADGIKDITRRHIESSEPVYNIKFDDGTENTVWIIDDKAEIDGIVSCFAAVESLYIADGHHRNAAAVKVALSMKEGGKGGDSAFDHYLSVLFPHDELHIMDYNRVLKDLNGYSAKEFLNRLSNEFEISKCGEFKPEKPHEFGMYLGGASGACGDCGDWYKLTAKPEFTDEGDVIGRLDVSILQSLVLEPVLGIKDVRTDKRIDFIGGIRGSGEICRRVDSGEMAVGFLMYPTSVEQLIEVASAGHIMPPKSTWFEPKLRSGLFVNRIAKG